MLRDFPEELLELCWQNCEIDELRALRLCSKSMLSAASKCLFRQVILLPTKQSARKCLKLTEDDALRLFVAELTFKHDIEEDNDYGLKDDSDGEQAESDAEESDDDDEDEIPEQYKQCCRNITRFANLQSVKICFSENVVAPEDKNDPYRFIGKEVAPCEELEFKDNIMRLIFEELHRSTANIKHLTVVNLQNVNVEATSDLESFKAVLSGLKTLALQIATERDDACPEHDIQKSELHTFFKQDLSRVWLQPLQTQLTSLTLYCVSYWGYFPGCPLEELHFPQLKHLSLGNYTFTHDSQLDWILTHGQTLQSLSLDDCPIIHHCTFCCKFRDGRLPPSVKDFTETYTNEDDTWVYEARWHDYFSSIQSGLPKLKNFRIGHGEDWNTSDGPMVTRHLLGSELVAMRYVAFHGGTLQYGILLSCLSLTPTGTGPSQWIEPDMKYTQQEDGTHLTQYVFDGCWDGEEDKPKFPDCEELDKKALDELLEAVRSHSE